MEPGRGKQKGAEFERGICKKLSLFVSEGERDNIFWRSAMSGGRATVQAKKGIMNSMQSGDISAIDPLGYPFVEAFYTEIKFYANVHLQSLIFGKPSKNSILDFWKQTQTSSILQRKDPILIAKQNRCDILLGVSICSKIGKYLANEWMKDENIPMLGVFPKYDLSLFSFDIFLKEIDPASLIHLYKKLTIVT